ncbi:MAG: TonB-dependent receptor plug domain-containing protein, partial [Bacteroidaceae bacterium]|nr:TonB-dependent receptor plug domain-containing protein [Bacteroidaceae bacterium]
MNKCRFVIALSLLTASAFALTQSPDTLDHKLGDVVVTGTRVAADQRHLPYTVSVVGREKLTEQQRLNILPTLGEEVPGLFLTSRGMMGYAVSTNAAGGLSLRGLSSSTGQLLVLIDGHPQYQGIYSHSIADASQTMLADRVEVLRGPASVLYGSNAMGGVVNIVTREKHEDGAETSVSLGAGSYGTVQAEASNQVRSGRYSHTVAANYVRTDNHRKNMGFEQYGGYVKFNYDMAEHWNAYADINLTHFNASNPGPVSRPLYDARQWITRGAATVALENHYGRTSGALSVYSSFGRHKINDGTADPSNPSQRYFRSKDALTGISLWQSISLWQGGRLTGGLD